MHQVYSLCAAKVPIDTLVPPVPVSPEHTRVYMFQLLVDKGI